MTDKAELRQARKKLAMLHRSLGTAIEKVSRKRSLRDSEKAATVACYRRHQAALDVALRMLTEAIGPEPVGVEENIGSTGNARFCPLCGERVSGEHRC